MVIFFVGGPGKISQTWWQKPECGVGTRGKFNNSTGLAQPVSLFGCPHRLLLLFDVVVGESAAGEIQTQVTLGAMSP